MQYLRKAHTFLKKLPITDIGVLILEFDGSDQNTNVDGVTALYTMLMIHVKVVWYHEGQWTKEVHNVATISDAIPHPPTHPQKLKHVK